MLRIKKIAVMIICICAVTLATMDFTGISASAATIYGGATLTNATRLTMSNNEMVLDTCTGTSLHKNWFIFTPTKSSNYLITLTTPGQYTYANCSLYSYEFALQNRRVRDDGYDDEASDTVYTDMKSSDVGNMNAAVGELGNGISTAQYTYQVHSFKNTMSFHVALDAGKTYALYLSCGGNASIPGTLAFTDSGNNGGGFSTPVSTFACTGSDNSGGTATFHWTVPSYTSCSGGTSSTPLTIQQSTDGNTWTTSTTSVPIGATDTTATVTGILQDKNYQFRLMVPIGDNTGWSNTASVNTKAGALTAPTPDVFSGTTASWSTVPGASGYTVTLHRPDSTKVSYSTSGTFYPFTSGSDNSDFTANGTYYFTVVANGDNSTTFASAEGTSSTCVYIAGAPTITSISADAGNYYSDDYVTITVNFNQAMNISGVGSNSLLLNVGGKAETASCISDSGTSAINFKYYVGTGVKGAITVTGFSSNINLVSAVSNTAADRTLPVVNLSGVYAKLANQQPTFSTTSATTNLLTSSATPISLYSDTNATVGSGESGMGQKFQSLKLYVLGVTNTENEYLMIDGSKVSLPTSTAGTISGTTTANGFQYLVTYILNPGPIGVDDYQYYYSVTITKTGDFTEGEYNTLINGIKYGVTQDALSGDRLIEIMEIVDNGGTEHNGSNILGMFPADHKAIVTVVHSDLAPTITATGTNPTYYTNSTAKLLFNVTALDAVESAQNITGVTIGVSGVKDNAEALVIDGTAVALTNGTSGTTTGGNNIAYSVSVTSGTATVTLTKADTGANWMSYLNGIAYQNTSTSAQSGSRTVTLEAVTDSGSTDNGGKNTVSPAVVSSVEVKVPVTDVSLDATTKNLQVGDTATLMATVAPANATDKIVNWSSSDDGIATVDSTGKITAVGAGTATVTATTEDGSKTANCSITVNSVTVTSVTVKTAPTKTTYTAGDVLDLTGLVVTLHKSNNTTEEVAFADFTTKGITANPTNGTGLSTSNTSVTITYTADNKSVSQTITVNPAPVTVTSVTVKTAPTKTTYTAGDALDLAGLVVTLHKSNNTTEEVAFADFATKGITANPTNGTGLSTSDIAVTITYTADNKSVSQTITVNSAPVVPGVNSAAISPTNINYDLNAPADVVTGITWNDASTVTDVAYGTNSLTPDVYTVSGSALTIKSSYLNTLGASKGNTLTFKISFDKGSFAILSVNVVDSNTPIEPATHSITLQSGGNGSVSANMSSAAKDTQITLTPAPDSGYRFREWQVIDGGVTITENKFIMPDNRVTVKAIFEPIPATQYPVAVNGSYAAVSGAGSHASGDIVTVSAGSRDGYTFTGWSSADGISFTNASSETTTFTMPGGNINVTANWSYNSNTGGNTGGNSGGNTGGNTGGSGGNSTGSNTGNDSTNTQSELIVNGTPATVDGTNGNTATITASQITNQTVSRAVVSIGETAVTLPADVLHDALEDGTGLTLTQTVVLPASTLKEAQEAAEKTDGVALAVININLNRIVTGGTEEIHNLSGEVTVSITLTEEQIAQIKAGKQAYIYYFDPVTGTLSDMKAVFDLNAKTATFSTKHFSSYVLAVTDLSAPTINMVNMKEKSVKNNSISSSNVTVTISDLPGVTKAVTRNGKAYAWPSKNTFTKDGKYIITVKDELGKSTKQVFTIDKTAPVITVKTGKKGNTISIKEANIASKTVTMNGKKIAWPKNNVVTQKGIYVIMVTDQAKHKTKYKFKIV